MVFDRQVLYLAVSFGVQNVLAVPFSLPAIENVSAESSSAIRASAVQDVASHAAKTSSLRNNSPLSSPSSPGIANYQNDETLPAIRVLSASATASPSSFPLTSPNKIELRDFLSKASRSPTRPGDVKSGPPDAIDGQDHKRMASASITSSADASVNTDEALEMAESLYSLVYNKVNSAVASVAASSEGGALTTSVSVAATPTNALDVLFSALPSDVAGPLQSEVNSFFPGLVGDQSSANTATPSATNALDALFSALPSSVAGPLRSEVNSVISGVVVADQSATDSAAPTTTNFLDPIFSALPSSVAGPLRSEVNSLLPGFIPGTTTSTGTRTNRPTHRPTNNRPNTHTTPNHRPTTTHPTTLRTTHTTGTPSVTGMSQAQTTDANPEAAIGANPISNASIAGIVSGLGAGFVVAGLAGLYIFRRKKAGKPVIGGLGRGGSKRSSGSGPYPQVAWLYDPKMSPPGGNSRSGSVADGAEERLIPERPGSAGPGDDRPPGLGPVRPSSPLLAPHMPPSRDRSPSPSRSRDSRAASIDASQGLLRPVSQE